ncbi:uncharacterized protein METZ01_LOCUS93115 [marine metagenome]|uniref:DUF4175 domain-containing protein n=1 Tax=marine metagenome TaxID=408172 RepID=A0A381VJR1_9ZZZZ
MSKQPADTENLIEDKLLEAWKQEQRFFHLRGLGRFLVWLVAMVLVDFVVDWQIFFRSRWETPGILLLLLNGVVLLWVLWREWFRHLKPYEPLRVALEVEKKHPKLRSVLVSFTQFKDFNAEETEASPELLEAMRKQAISLTRPLDFNEVVDFSQLKKLAVVSLASIGFFMLINAQWEEHMQMLFKRLLGEDIEYPTETSIISTSGDIPIKEGNSTMIFAEVEGKSPKTGSLFVRDEVDEDWEELEIKLVRGKFYAREKKEVIKSFQYKLKIGDDYSDEYTVSISPKPEPISKKITLSYPEYLQREDTVEDNLKLTVPMDTSIKWSLQCEPAIKALKVTIGGNIIMAEISEDGARAEFEAKATETFKYNFYWTEKEHGFEYNDIQNLVRVVPDQVPDVELVEPFRNGKATVNKVLDLKFRATDDHQLGEAALVYSIVDNKTNADGAENNASLETRVALGKLTGTQKEHSHRWVLNENGNLTPGSKVYFRIEVADRKPPMDSRFNSSVKRRLDILTDEQYLIWFENELAAQREIIAKARNAEEKATTEIGKLKVEEKKE